MTVLNENPEQIEKTGKWLVKAIPSDTTFFRLVDFLAIGILCSKRINYALK